MLRDAAIALACSACRDYPGTLQRLGLRACRILAPTFVETHTPGAHYEALRWGKPR